MLLPCTHVMPPQVTVLQGKCQETIDRANKLAKILDEGVAGMIDKAKNVMAGYVNELLETFRQEARSVQSETLNALENCEERLTERITVRPCALSRATAQVAHVVTPDVVPTARRTPSPRWKTTQHGFRKTWRSVLCPCWKTSKHR